VSEPQERVAPELEFLESDLDVLARGVVDQFNRGSRGRGISAMSARAVASTRFSDV
jgi:hypothetical protein